MAWLGRDLSFTLRSLRRKPGYTAAAVVTLALGIGANAAIFSTVYGVLLRPLPYPSSDRLAVVWAQWLAQDIPQVSHTGGDFRDYQRQAKSFEGLAAFGSVRQNLTGGEEPAQVQVGWVSRNFFSVLGVTPRLGRAFRPDEESDSLVLGNAFWHRQFAADPGILGRVVSLDGRPFTVIGVLPPGFKLYMSPTVGISTDIDVWKPPDEAQAPGRWVTQELQLSTLRVVGRLAPEVTVAQAQAEMDAVASDLRDRFPDHAEVDFHLVVRPLHQEVVGHVRSALLSLQGAVGFLLLIACLNVVSLLLVRANDRRQEIAIRLSLGSGPRAAGRQMAVEALVLAVAGGVVGVVLAYGGIRLLRYLAPQNLPRVETLAVDPPVLAFALGVTLLASVLSGLGPSLWIARWNLAALLREQSTGGSRRRFWLNKAFVVLEMAIALVLLVGAGLLMRSFLELQRVRPGFDPENLLTFSISLPGMRYEAPLQTADFLDRLEGRISRLPGVVSTGTVWPLPLEGQIWYGPYGNSDRPEADEQLLADYRMVSPGYIRTIGARLLEGRYLEDRDTDAILVDERFARENWPGRSALGRTIQAVPVGPEETFRVVGVVENVRHADLRSDGRETFYLPARGWSWTDWEMCLVVRTSVDPKSLVDPILASLHDLDPAIPMAKVRSMDEYVADATASNRFMFTLMLVFSCIALMLAAVGLYGVIAYSLGRRTREIGIQMALGADRKQILARILRDGLLVALVGVLFGVAGSLVLAKMISGLLFGVGATDLVTYAAVSAVLVAVAILSTWVPARRVARLDPVQVIRSD
jgi:putative ABC transport system permease protein